MRNELKMNHISIFSKEIYYVQTEYIDILSFILPNRSNAIGNNKHFQHLVEVFSFPNKLSKHCVNDCFHCSLQLSQPFYFWFQFEKFEALQPKLSQHLASNFQHKFLFWYLVASLFFFISLKNFSCVGYKTNKKKDLRKFLEDGFNRSVMVSL